MKTKTIFASFVVFSIVLYVLGILIPLGDDLFYYYSDLTSIITALIACLAFISDMKLLNPKSSNGRVWLLFTFGLILWVIGEIMWGYFELIEGIEVPYPSAADVVWLLGYIFLIAGSLSQVKIAEIPIEGKAKGIIACISIGFIALSWIFVIQPMIDYPVGDDFTALQKAVSILYPIGDAIIFTLTLIVFFRFKEGKFGQVWKFISLGYISIAFYDSLFIWLDWNELYLSWSLIEILYIGGYLLIAYGAIVFYSMMKSKM